MTSLWDQILHWDAIKDNRQAYRTFTTRHSCHIYYTKSRLNLFYAAAFGIKLLRMRHRASQNCYPQLDYVDWESFGCWSLILPPPFEGNWHPCQAVGYKQTDSVSWLLWPCECWLWLLWSPHFKLQLPTPLTAWILTPTLLISTSDCNSQFLWLYECWLWLLWSPHFRLQLHSWLLWPCECWLWFLWSPTSDTSDLINVDSNPFDLHTSNSNVDSDSFDLHTLDSYSQLLWPCECWLRFLWSPHSWLQHPTPLTLWMLTLTPMISTLPTPTLSLLWPCECWLKTFWSQHFRLQHPTPLTSRLLTPTPLISTLQTPTSSLL